MSCAERRLLLCLVMAGVWLMLLPAVVLADSCEDRAKAITAGTVGAKEPDLDCRPAGVLGATAATAGAATAAGLGGVAMGLAGGGKTAGGVLAPPAVQVTYGGNDATQILQAAGLIKPKVDSKGNVVTEPDPSNPNHRIPVYVPAYPGALDNLGGNPVTRTVGVAVDPATGKTTDVQNVGITGVVGFGGRLRPDGTLDPNVAIVVNQTPPGDFVPFTPPATAPPTTTTTATPATGTAATTPSGGSSGTTTAPGASSSATTPTQPQPPDQTTPPPPKPPLKPADVKIPPPEAKVPPPETKVPPPEAKPPEPKQPAKPDQADKPQAPSQEPRFPKTEKDLVASIAQPGRTIIPSTLGGYLGPDGKIVKLPGGLPDAVKNLVKDAQVDTSGGRMKLTGKVTLPDVNLGPVQLKGATVEGNIKFVAEDGRLVARPMDNNKGSQLLADAANLGLKSVNADFDKNKLRLDLLMTDSKGNIHIETKPK